MVHNDARKTQNEEEVDSPHTQEASHTSSEHEDADDILIEEDEDREASGIGGSPENTIQKLKKKLSECEKHKQEYLDGWQRAQADVVNTRSHETQERERRIKQTKELFITELLPIIDSFEMAFADTESYEQTPERWRNGVEGIHSQCMALLDRHDVVRFDPSGEVFDPHYHEAVDTQEVDDPKHDGAVVSVLQYGYKFGDTILRPAKVVVGAHRTQ